MQFLDYEKKNNSFIKYLSNPANTLFTSLLSDLAQPNVYLLVSQNVNLDGIEFGKEFLFAHIIYIDPSNPSHFVTKNGIIGIFSGPFITGNQKDKTNPLISLLILNLPPKTPILNPTSLFNAPIFQVEKEININNNSASIVILREGTIPIRDNQIKVLLIAEPIEYDGCSWVIKKQTGDETPPKPQVTRARSGIIVPNGQQTPSQAAFNQKKNNFIQKMNHPSAGHLVSTIRNFIELFLAKPPLPEHQQESVRNFLDSTEELIKRHPLWRDCSEKEFDETREGLEKYLIAKLFPQLFGREEEKKKDVEIQEKINKLKWIKLEHLEIKPEVHSDAAMIMACTELRKINSYKVPRDKLVCILNCCKLVYRMLSLGNGGAASGADDFLPLLIIVLIQANPPALQSNIQFIRRYRNPSKLFEEAGYYLTQLESSVHFLQNVKHSYLKNVTEEQFNKYISGEFPEEEPTPGPPPSNPPSPTELNPINSFPLATSTPTPFSLPPAATPPSSTSTPSSTGNNQNTISFVGEQKGNSILLQAQSILVESKDFEKYQFLNSTVTQLKIGDVYQLLDDYKKIARQNELLKKLLIHSQSFSNSNSSLPSGASSASCKDLDNLDLSSSVLDKSLPASNSTSSASESLKKGRRSHSRTYSSSK